MKFAFAASAVMLLGACPGGGGSGGRPYPSPKPEDVVAKLAARRAALRSFTGSSKMDYWLGNDRLKGDVLAMGEPGAHVHFLAESPAGGSPIAEMACDGKDFHLADTQHNCQLSGPCDAQSIAQFFHVALEPDDFVAIALGTPPVLPGATGSSTWDAKTGHETVELASAAGKETIVVDMRDGKLDVVSAKVLTPSGGLVWSVDNKDFGDVKDEAGKPFRVPMRAELKSPDSKADLIVEWGERKFNKQFPPEAWHIDIDPKLPQCGASNPGAPAGGAGAGSSTQPKP